MLRILPVLLIFVFLSVAVKAQHTDLKEYGYKGKVYSVTAFNYDSARKTAKGWEPYDTASFRSAMIFYFSDSGRLDSIDIVFRTLIQGREFIPSRIVYDRKGGRKTGYTYYDYKDEMKEFATITWKDAYTYEVVTRGLDGKVISESSSVLDKNFREITTTMRQYRSDTVAIDEECSNVFDKNRQLTGANYTDNKRNRKYTVTYTQQAVDEKGNATEVVAYNTTDKKLKRFVIRKFRYY